MSLYDRASVIAGRSCTRSKAPDRLLRAWAKECLGALILDTEGRQYIDMVCGLGAISLGYGYHLGTAGPRGVYSLPHVLEIEAAEAVLQHVAPWASSVRFVKTGSEATHAAYRVAKAATGRPYVLRGGSAYHGWHEWTETAPSFPDGYDFGSRGYFTFTEPNSIRTFSDEAIAAVFVEPPRFTPIDIAWLRKLREYCTRTGALLVFDEMIWGGRWALGGCSEYTGVIPDLACYGKAFGNGEAAAFIVGGEALAQHGEIISGTFSGDTTGLQAVVDTLHVYTSQPVVAALWDRARYLYEGFADAVPSSFCTLSGPAPLMGLQFVNPEHKVPFKDAMHARGILTYPDWLMVNYSHTEELLERVIKAAGEACTAVA